jgi:hypothetical protein
MQLEADIANLREISELQEARCIELNAMLGDRDQTLEISQVCALYSTLLYFTRLYISDSPQPSIFFIFVLYSLLPSLYVLLLPSFHPPLSSYFLAMPFKRIISSILAFLLPSIPPFSHPSSLTLSFSYSLDVHRMSPAS